MSTRHRAQRGDDQKEFVGRCRKWKREWKPEGTDHKSKKLYFQRWVTTDERDSSCPGKRHPNIVPVPNPKGKPLVPAFMRAAPKVTLKLKLGVGGPSRQPFSNPDPAAGLIAVAQRPANESAPR